MSSFFRASKFISSPYFLKIFRFYNSKIITWLWAGDSGVLIPENARSFFSSPKFSEELWGPPSLLINECQWFLPGG
jgi:hypothetical protein